MSNSEEQSIAELAQPAQKRSLSKLFLFSGGVIAFLLVFAFTFAVIQYRNASTRLSEGEFSRAKQAFSGLNWFWNARNMVIECDYRQAGELLAKGEYRAADPILARLGDYKNSADLEKECDRVIEYDNAVTYLKHSRLIEAKKIFTELGDYRDSRDKLEECKRVEQYQTALKLIDDGSMQSAVDTLESLGDFRDARKLALLCQVQLDYQRAEEELAQGRFYSAYAVFSRITGYIDSQLRAQACIQMRPQGGEVYRNKDYPSKAVPLTIFAPEDEEDRCVFFKILSEDDVLVSSIFLKAGESAKVALPAGKYKFMEGVGKNWFGERDAFGKQEAVYYALKTNQSYLFSFEWNYIYTLTLEQFDRVNGGMEEISPDNFCR